VWLGVLVASLWAMGAVMQGRITMLEALMVESAALATATAALGFIDLHRVFKPLTMVLAIAFVLLRTQWCAKLGRFDALLAGRAGHVAGGRCVPDVPRLFHPRAGFLPDRAPVLHRPVPAGAALVPQPPRVGYHAGRGCGHVRLFVGGWPATPRCACRWPPMWW
jgi:hypothetical protein